MKLLSVLNRLQKKGSYRVIQGVSFFLAFSPANPIETVAGLASLVDIFVTSQYSYLIIADGSKECGEVSLIL